MKICCVFITEYINVICCNGTLIIKLRSSSEYTQAPSRAAVVVVVLPVRAECREPCSAHELEVQPCSPSADRVCRARASLDLGGANAPVAVAGSSSSSSSALELGLVLSESRALVAFEDLATRRETRSAALHPNSAAARAIGDGRAFQLEPPLAHSEQLAVRVSIEQLDLVPQLRAVDHSALNENAAFRASQSSSASTVLNNFCPFPLPTFYWLTVQSVSVRVTFVHLPTLLTLRMSSLFSVYTVSP